MFQKSNQSNNELKSETNQIGSNSSVTIDEINPNFNERYNMLASNLRHQTNTNYHNHPHLTTTNNREEIKSHISSNKSSRFSHNFKTQHSQQDMQSTSSNSNNLTNQRTSASQSNNMIRSTTNPQLFQAPYNYHQSSSATLSTSNPISPPTTTRSNFNSEQKLQARHRALMERVSSSVPTGSHSPHNLPRDSSSGNKFANTTHTTSRLSQDHQQDKDQDEVVTMIREKFANNSEDIDLEAISSLEKDLPVELSFLIRQQAYCMARMNYLDRQIRELKESTRSHQTVAPQHQQLNHQQVTPSSIQQAHQFNHRTSILAPNATTLTHMKNGNFIPSDDSGGEYSRATMSDDDELSSLLDQIAKSVRPDRNVNQNVSINQQPQLQQRSNYSVISNQPQQYTIISPNQLHHQAVPVFVMGSPIAVAHPASSISSTVLPGVHFQPEPRYNQYYEDFYIQNNSSSSTLHRHNNNGNNVARSQQLDSSISTIEQLVSQKEKRQIKSQLKSADNWLKMRSSNLCNLTSTTNDNFSIKGTNNNVDVIANGGTSVIERNLPTSSSASVTLATENSNSVIEENRSR